MVAEAESVPRDRKIVPARSTTTKFSANGSRDGAPATATRVQPAVTKALISFAIRASEGRWMYIMCPASK